MSQDEFSNAISVDELISLVMRAYKPRATVGFGIEKVAGVSLQKTRRQANDAAIELLKKIPEGVSGESLTDEQREILAKYTGEGGLEGEGGSQYEYYTPQFMAEGIWDLMDAYSATSGHVLEPSAGTGIFQESKPKSAIMTSAEISPISGRINQLLHPEDNVNLGAFERLAVSTPDGTYDHAVGNVPFGKGRSGYAELDPAYAKESNIGHYFVLRTIDKVKPGGMIVLVVPNGMTDGSNDKKLRDKVSRMAEFLGAHRMPSGTFEESGTATVVDVWILRKHSEALKEAVDSTPDKALKAANVLWPEFITGKWFLQDGKRFVHGTMERSDYQNMLVVRKDGQITNATMKAALARRFESRIDFTVLGAPSLAFQGAKEGDKRLVGGIWHEFNGVRWIKDVTVDSSAIDAVEYGASTFAELSGRVSSTEGLLSFTPDQLYNIARRYPQSLPESVHAVVQFAVSQPAELRSRVMRGSLIGLQIIDGMDANAKSNDGALLFADAAKLAASEFATYGRSDKIKVANLSSPQSRAWLAFQGNISETGEVSALLSGTLLSSDNVGVNMTDPDQVVAHLFNQISLTPLTLDNFREAFEGELPAEDEAALNYLAGFKEVAIDGFGNLTPMARATSGNVRGRARELLALANSLPEGNQRDNVIRQIDGINAKRKHVELKNIRVNLNARWVDRRLIKEFLEEQGYDKFRYTSPELEIEDGILISADDYEGKDGVFTGYQMRSVVSGKTGVREFKKANNADGFLNQFENYLNGVKPRGTNAGEYLDKITALEDSFNEWLSTHASATQVEEDYNDAFNGHIPFSHSDASLNLSGISGKRIPTSYQNEEVRRLSEDGRGIMGLGTGLGKTTAGLALEAYNFESGRTKRTATVVPKAVYQNWYHEAKEFYSEDVFNTMLFVGIEPVIGVDGKAIMAQVKSEKDEPLFDQDGQPVMRTVVKDSSSADILLRLNKIPTSNWRNVILTKEQFASIPLRQETIEANQQQAVFDAIESGRINIGKSSHREASKINRLKDKAADTGSAKKQNVPYFEDMNFDSVITDEGHNYRNSFSAGREASQLAYLPNPAVSQVSRDMAVKASYLMKKNNGRGVVMLSATPVVNSPIDIFNMLSNVMPNSEWQAMGIYTPDDFVRIFGKTETVTVQKISGETEEKQGLVAFQNLDGLRGIFRRWASIKTAADVKAAVKIPDIIDKMVDVPMTDEQVDLYEELRTRASNLGKKVDPAVAADGTEVGSGKNEDAIFSIIRDMDKVTLDPDLYHGQVRFQFQEADAEKVQAIFAKLPKTAGGEKSDDGDSDGDDEESLAGTSPRIPKIVKTTLTDNVGYLELTVSTQIEKDVLHAIAEAGIDLKTVSHPIPPKYAALIENLRSGLEDGKQIIFIDEKTQHGKLQRIIAQALGMEISEIGIINASTVSANNKVKLKKVNPPTEPAEAKDGSYKPGAWDKFYEQKTKYEDYLAAQSDMGLAGMEGIAADYNEGRTPIVICNKKAEVGINLHKGTTDIHHLTFPWTPASINQRNGRGARVGSTHDSVRAHYYCGKGTFDDFRVDTLQKKKDWLNSIMTSDESTMINGDASDSEERAVMLAANPEERRATLQKQKEAREAERTRTARKQANNALNSFLKASKAATRSIPYLESQLETIKGKVNTRARQLEEKRQKQLEKEQLYNDNVNEDTDTYKKKSFAATRLAARKEFKEASDELLEAQKDQRNIENTIKRAKAAQGIIKRSRADLKRAMDNGVTDVDQDVLDNPSLYAQTQDGKLVRVGAYYETALSNLHPKALVQLESVDAENNTCSVLVVSIIDKTSSYSAWRAGQSRNITLDTLAQRCTYSPSELDLISKASKGVRPSDIAVTFSRDQWTNIVSKYGVNVAKFRDGMKWLVATAEGFDVGEYADKRLLGDNVVYPDVNDEQLKARVAEYITRTKKYYSLTEFLKALFGENASEKMQAYGEQATVQDVEAHFDKLEEAFEKENAGISFKKPGIKDAIDFYQGSRTLGYDIGNLYGTAQATRTLSTQYRNEKQIALYVKNVSDARKEARTNTLNLLADNYTQAITDAIKNVTDNQIQSVFKVMSVASRTEIIQSITAGDVLRSDVPLYLAIGKKLGTFKDNYSDLAFASYNTLITAIDLVIRTFSDITNRHAFKSLGLFENEANMTLEEWSDAMSGSLSAEQRENIDARRIEKVVEENMAAEALINEVGEHPYSVENINVDFASSVKSKFKGRFYTRSINAKAGGVILYDESATLYLKAPPVRAYLKDSYNAVFWDFEQNPIEGVNVRQKAWVIESQVNVKEITNEINKIIQN